MRVRRALLARRRRTGSSSRAGLPTIAVRDLAVQARDGDLGPRTFGRGFYILDDVTPLRGLTREALEKPATLLPVRDAVAYIESSPLGGKGKAFLGDAFFTADNPPFGAVFTYYLKDSLKTRKELRHDTEKEAEKKGIAPAYPTPEQLREEAREEKPAVILTVTDAEGNVVRRVSAPAEKGFHRVAWDLRFAASGPAKLPSEEKREGPLGRAGRGPDGRAGNLQGRAGSARGGHRHRPRGFATVPRRVARSRHARRPRQGRGAHLRAEDSTATEGGAGGRRGHEGGARAPRRIKVALAETPAARSELADQARAIEARLADLQMALSGDRVLEKYSEPTPPSIEDRVQGIVYSLWATTQAPTGTMQEAYDDASGAFAPALAQLRAILDGDSVKLDAALDSAGVPGPRAAFKIIEVPGTSKLHLLGTWYLEVTSLRIWRAGWSWLPVLSSRTPRRRRSRRRRGSASSAASVAALS